MPPSYNQPTSNQNTDNADQLPSLPVGNELPLQVEPPTTSFSSPPSPEASEPRNLLAALLLTLSFGTTGLHQLYLGRTKQAWIRFGLIIGMFVLSVLMFISSAFGIIAGLLAVFVLPVLFVWGIIDIFKVYLKRVDGDGNALQAGPRDAKAAKLVFWATIILNSAMIVLTVITAFTSIRSYNGIQDRARESTNLQDIRNEQLQREFNQQYR